MTLKQIVTVGVSAAALVVGASSASAAPIVGLYNTGVTATGTVQANNSAELHYALIAPSVQISGVRTADSTNGYPIGPWLGDNSLSSWIGPVGDNQLDGPAGNYTYRTTFSLAGLNAATASITGRWSVDDGGVDILLNGNSLGIVNNNGFQTFTAFSIPSGFFTSGLNTLDFVVNNGGGPTGLRVEMTGTASPLATPEPATWAMMVLGFGLVGAGLRRKQVVRVTYA